MDDDTVRITPIFELNGKISYTDKDYLLFKEKVSGDTITYKLDNNYSVREYRVGVLFPHPRQGEVKITENFAYIIRNK